MQREYHPFDVPFWCCQDDFPVVQDLSRVIDTYHSSLTFASTPLPRRCMTDQVEALQGLFRNLVRCLWQAGPVIWSGHSRGIANMRNCCNYQCRTHPGRHSETPHGDTRSAGRRCPAIALYLLPDLRNCTICYYLDYSHGTMAYRTHRNIGQVNGEAGTAARGGAFFTLWLDVCDPFMQSSSYNLD